ncbi:MAG: hypothetical protein R3F24_13270 [Gammaproteobacteria bacterium]
MNPVAVLPWLSDPLARFEARMARGQTPQGLLIHGPVGCGRRHLALSIAARLLESDWRPSPDMDGDELPGVPHPDFWVVGIEGEAKSQIKVDQIRELNHVLNMTSHQRGRKVAMIFPAEAMNPNAANTFLKTLEEPSEGTTVLLVATSAARLPATVLSRCERLRITPPGHDLALSWLAAGYPDRAVCERALAYATGAPLLARSLLGDGDGKSSTSKALTELGTDLQQLVDRSVTPIAVARTWARRDSGVCLRWLYLQTAALIGDSQAESGAKLFSLKIPRAAVNMAACFAYLDQVVEAQRLKDRSLNMEAAFADLLMWWYGAAGATR